MSDASDYETTHVDVDLAIECGAALLPGLPGHNLRRHPTGCGVFELVLRQPPYVGTIGAHHVNLAIRLRVVRMQRYLVRESGPRAGERDPLSIAGPRHVRVVPGVFVSRLRSVPSGRIV